MNEINTTSGTLPALTFEGEWLELEELSLAELVNGEMAWSCLASIATGGSLACAGSCGSSVSSSSTLSSAS